MSGKLKSPKVIKLLYQLQKSLSTIRDQNDSLESNLVGYRQHKGEAEEKRVQLKVIPNSWVPKSIWNREAQSLQYTVQLYGRTSLSKIQLDNHVSVIAKMLNREEYTKDWKCLSLFARLRAFD